MRFKQNNTLNGYYKEYSIWTLRLTLTRRRILNGNKFTDFFIYCLQIRLFLAQTTNRKFSRFSILASSIQYYSS